MAFVLRTQFYNVISYHHASEATCLNCSSHDWAVHFSCHHLSEDTVRDN